MPDAQVIVVGGGPAGSSAAYFMARAGLDVLLLDRARFPRDKPCSEYMSPQASRILAEMGALDAVESSGRRAAHRNARARAERRDDPRRIRRRITGIADSAIADWPCGERYSTQFFSSARATPALASRKESASPTSCKDHRGGCHWCPTRPASGAPGTINAGMVIGADGLRSVVGRRLGLIRASRWPRRIALVTHYRNVQGSRQFGEMHVDRGGYLGIADVGNGLTNVAVVVPVSRAAEIAADRTEFLESWIAERPAIAEMFTTAERVDPVRATGPFASAARRAWTPGAALVGDAADFFDPFTGEGIYTALRGGELLASHIAESFDGMRRGTSGDGALRAYDTARRAEFGGKWKVEKLVGAAVAFPTLINRAANVLSRRRDMADLLVGVVGDFVPAREVLSAGYLLRLMLPPAGA